MESPPIAPLPPLPPPVLPRNTLAARLAAALPPPITTEEGAPPSARLDTETFVPLLRLLLLLLFVVVFAGVYRVNLFTQKVALRVRARRESRCGTGERGNKSDSVTQYLSYQNGKCGIFSERLLRVDWTIHAGTYIRTQAVVAEINSEV